MALNKTKSEIKNSLGGTNVCIVGNPKVGKTKFAANLKFDSFETYYLRTEPGTKFVSVYGDDIRDWPHFMEIVSDLIKQKKSADDIYFSMVAIDTTDNLVTMLEKHICTINKVKAISDIPYGGGYSAIKQSLLNEIQALNNAGLGVVFITHAKDKELTKDAFKWTAVVTSLSTGVEEKVLGICDFILYFHIDKNNKRAIRCKPTKYVTCAGDRSGLLPEIIEVPEMNLNYNTEFFTKYFNMKQNEENKGK